MKRHPCFLLAAAVTVCLAASHSARAGLLPPGGTDSSLPLYSSTATLVDQTPLLSFSFSSNNGSIQEVVLRGYGANPFVNGTLGTDANALTLNYYVQVSGGDVNRVTGSNFGSFLLDVGYGYNLFGHIAPPGSVVPVSADRSSDGSVVGFNFSDVGAGQISAIMIVNTDVNNYTTGTIGVFNGTQGQSLVGEGFVPTASAAPEPASLTLLGMGGICFGGLAWLRWRKLGLVI